MCLVCSEIGKERSQEERSQKERYPRAIAVEFLEWLGENDPGLLLGTRRVRSINGDLAIYAFCQLGVYRNEEIGRVFGKGYAAVAAAVKCARKYLEETSRLETIIKKGGIRGQPLTRDSDPPH